MQIENMTPEQYREHRALVVREFAEKAKAEREAFDANPSAFTVSEAIGIVGVDKAIALHVAGKLKD